MDLLKDSFVKQMDEEFEYLYPNLDDPQFNTKISLHKEFADNRILEGAPNTK